MNSRPQFRIVVLAVGFLLWTLAACTPAPKGPAPEPILPPTGDAAVPEFGQTNEAKAGEIDLVGDVEFVAIAEDLNRPLFVTGAGDDSGRIFIIEQGGAIRIWRDGELSPTPFLDISERVNDDAPERGLLGLAFAPDYADSGSFFVDYTDADGATVVARFTADPNDPDRADPTSERQVLRIEQPASNHNGGMLLFGPDGYLYIGTGDGGAANDKFGNGQNPETLLGKMLRIDVSNDDEQPYAIPPDNPWVAVDWNGVDVRDEIWAVGLRNPWRYSFDRATGDLWIADVGQRLYEEIDLIPAGASGPFNFGWPLMEGNHCFPENTECDPTGLVLPVLEYSHEGSCSVTGGYVYRGQAFPGLDGVYFYSDYCSGDIWTLIPDGGGGWRNAMVLDTDMSVSSFGEDDQGELYVTDLGGGGVYRIVLAE